MTAIPDLPETMTAVAVAAPGGPEALRPERRPRPLPQGGEVLIAVEAAGVNGPDLMQRKGLYPPPPGASDIPGLEVCGRVVALGPEAAGPALGDRVCALLTGGGYAEYALAEAALCLPVPAGLDAIQAAALPEVWFTAWSNLVDRAHLLAGEVLLVQGGAGGIGNAAIQLGVSLGARVFATAGGPDKARLCQDLGAMRGIDYRAEDFAAVVRDATGGHGADVILDMVGGDYVQRHLGLLAEDGRLVQIAFLQGPKAQLNLLPVMLKRLVVTGATLRPRPVGFKSTIAQALALNIWPHLASGRLRTVIDSTFPLAQAAAAHARLESGAHAGKVVLTVA